MRTLSVWKTSPGRRADRSEWSWSRDWTIFCSSVKTVGGFMVRVPTYFTDPNPSMLRCRLPNLRRISSSAPSDQQQCCFSSDSFQLSVMHQSINMHTSNVTSCHWGPKCKRSWHPLASVITTLCYVTVLSTGQSPMLQTLYFHRQVWYRTLSLHYACTRSSDIILIP